jgi:hypothetical protein
MSTIPQEQSHPTHASFGAIDQHVNRLELPTGDEPPLEPGGRMERLIYTYSGVRPILAALSIFPLIPDRWCEALHVFVGLMDGYMLAAPPVHTKPIGPSVAME